jgi:threonine aldolase
MNTGSIIELRSDTFTKPTKAMLEAMFSAKVGDDVFEEDEVVNTLETKVAKLFGMEAALFCPSGTMTNQLAIRTHCQAGDEVICDALSHVYIYEGGGIAVNALSSVKTVAGDRGRITADQVRSSINNPNDIHQPITKLVSLENTANRGGGSIYDFKEIKTIKSVCVERNLKLHLDGARLFNALIESEENPSDYGSTFDTISICLSKGLGCPVGSLVIGKKDVIEKARRFRKLMGGGWRQAGYLAAAGIYALDHHIDRLKDDHRRAKLIAETLQSKSFVSSLYPVDTNIVIFQTVNELPARQLVDKLNTENIKCIAMNDSTVRMVTHLDFNDDDLDYLIGRLKMITLP